MPLTSAKTPRVRPAWFSWSVVAAALMSTVILIVAIVITGLWVIMPGWFHRLIVVHSPWFEPAYYASQRADQVMEDLVKRFAWTRDDHHAVMSFLAERLVSDDEETRIYAANVFSVMQITRKGAQGTIELDPTIRKELIAGMISMLNRPSNGEQIAAIWALGSLSAYEHLPQMLEVARKLPTNLSSGVVFPLGSVDDANVTSLFVEWFEHDPSLPLINGLARQSDPRAATCLITVLQTPRHAMMMDTLSTLVAHPTQNVELLTALKPCCLDTNLEVRRMALVCVSRSPAGIPFLLDLREDPTAAMIHLEVDKELKLRTADMTVEQRRLWHDAPPLTELVPAAP